MEAFLWLGPAPLTLLLQVLCWTSQGSPVSRQWGPLVLGETSPSLAWANAAINLTWLGRTPGFMSISNKCDARPLLSPDMNPFVLFIDVQCTGNQLKSERDVSYYFQLHRLLQLAHWSGVPAVSNAMCPWWMLLLEDVYFDTKKLHNTYNLCEFLPVYICIFYGRSTDNFWPSPAKPTHQIWYGNDLLLK